MEIDELAARWREEEELAGIIDGELTLLPRLESLRGDDVYSSDVGAHRP